MKIYLAFTSHGYLKCTKHWLVEASQWRISISYMYISWSDCNLRYSCLAYAKDCSYFWLQNDVAGANSIHDVNLVSVMVKKLSKCPILVRGHRGLVIEVKIILLIRKLVSHCAVYLVLIGICVGLIVKVSSSTSGSFWRLYVR